MYSKLLALVFLSYLMSFTRSQVQMDSCSINCDSRNVLCQPEVTDRIINSRPGKLGPTGDVGPKGDKGEPAEQCECNELAGVLQQLQDLQRELNQTNRNYDLVMQAQQALDRRVENLSNKPGRSRQFPMRLMSALHPTHSYCAEDGHIYVKTNTKQTWSASRTICQSFGGDLAAAAFKQSDEREKLGKAFTAPSGYVGMWVGLTKAAQEGTWKWVDGSNAISTEIQWSSNQPDNYRGVQDCGQLWGSWSGYRMDDLECEHLRPALCEIRPLE